MRAVVWNMSYWQKSETERASAWDWLHASGADIALLQEAVPPHGLRSVVYEPIGGSRPWGSAVIGFTLDLDPVTAVHGRANTRPVELARSHPGTVAVATFERGGRLITAGSLYGLIDKGYADSTVHRQLSDLSPLLDDPKLGKHLLLGGDLNITTQWIGRHARYRTWEAATFARIAALGLQDCFDKHRSAGPLDGCGCADGAGCRHIRTQYHAASTRPWQNDYVFATGPLFKLNSAARVVDDATTRQLSSHLPLVLDFDL